MTKQRTNLFNIFNFRKKNHCDIHSCRQLEDTVEMHNGEKSNLCRLSDYIVIIRGDPAPHILIQPNPAQHIHLPNPCVHCQIWEKCQSASLTGFPYTMWHGSKKAPTSRNVTNCETQLSENPVTEWENKIIVFPCVHWPIFIVRVKRFVNFNNGRKIISVTLTAQHWIPVWMHAQGWTLLHCTHWIEWRWETHEQRQ